MEVDHQDVFDPLDDNLDKTLKKLRTEIPSSEASISIEIKNALNSIERGLEILVSNTNVKTNKVNPAAFSRSPILSYRQQ